MKRLSATLLLALLGIFVLTKNVHAANDEEQSPEGFDCVECTLTRGPAVVLEEDVKPAEHMEKFMEKLPVPKSQKPSPGISRSPAIVPVQDGLNQ